MLIQKFEQVLKFLTIANLVKFYQQRFESFLKGSKFSNFAISYNNIRSVAMKTLVPSDLL